MKKLMVAVAIVCAAICSQAAQFGWTSYALDENGGEGFTGGQAYLVMVTDAANFAVADDLSITGGTIVDSIRINNSEIRGAWQDTGSLVSGTEYLFAIIGTTAGTGAKTEGGYAMPTTGFFGVDYDGDGGSAPNFYTATWNADTGAGIEINWDNLDAGAFMETPVQSVPEPTSGLLLLLGVAGLALRRRRA